MLSTRPTVQKRRTIVMLTSCNQTIAFHFTETCPHFHRFFPFFSVFYHFSYALVPTFSSERQRIYGKELIKKMKIRKSGIFLQTLFF